MIPFIDLKREWAHFESRFLEVFTKFGRDGSYVLGDYLEGFEKRFASYCEYKHAIGVSSGLAALEVALLAHGVKPGDEVITVANSAVATSLAISNIGAKPVFCDVKSDFLIDESAIEKLITEKTKAILPVHLFGKICDMAAINEIAGRRNLEIVEDACQAHGAVFSGESSANTKAFSFYPTKNLGALGEGGAILTNNEAVKDFASSYRNYGQKGRYNHEIKGNNYRLDPLQCALLDVKLDELNDFVGKRQTIAKKYCDSLRGLKDIEINDFDGTCSYHLFVVKIKNGRRDALKNALKEKGIDTALHYPMPIHRQPCYRDEFQNVKLPNTDRLQDEILSLPCYPFLTVSELDEIIINIKSFFE